MMTRKDFVAIGSVLRAEWAIIPSAQVWKITLSIADKFAQSNPRFDRAKFYNFVFGEDHWAARERIV